MLQYEVAARIINLANDINSAVNAEGGLDVYIQDQTTDNE